MNNITTYEDYMIEMKKQIDIVMEKLYVFEKSENNSGVRECYEIAKIILNLGSVSDNLRPYLHNNIPPQHTIINDWLLNIDVEKLNTIFSVALLRYTGVIRQKIDSWVEFRDKVSLKLEKEGKDSKKILVGLL